MNVFDLKGLERRLEIFKNDIKKASAGSVEHKIIGQKIHKLEVILVVDRYIKLLEEVTKLIESNSNGLDYRAKCATANFALEFIRRYFRGVNYIDHTLLDVNQIKNKENWARIILNAFIK